jgi:DNA modification methylase
MTSATKLEPLLFHKGRVQLYKSDCREALKMLPDNSIDSCVTDPPYALVSIVKRFGKEGSSPPRANGPTGVYKRAAAGFMGKAWDTGETAFDPEFWSEVLRVLKPGAHVLAFGGTRTYHRLAVAIEDGGFEIRDAVMWHYGSGFPKSHDVSKAIDKALGARRKIIEETSAFGIGGHGCLNGHAGGATYKVDDGPVTDAAREWEGWGTALKPATEIICLARKPLIGTIAENVLRWGTGALNIGACRIVGVAGDEPAKWETPRGGIWKTDSDAKATLITQNKGRWPANVIHDGSDEVIATFPEAVGAVSNGRKGKQGLYNDGIGSAPQLPSYADDGSAARFFYTSKADADDRIGSKHPTVKPVDLMQYLVRLITPKDGVCLDPFAGTGTTVEATLREGMRCILVEKEVEYQNDIECRMKLVYAGENERRVASKRAKPEGLFKLAEKQE